MGKFGAETSSVQDPLVKYACQIGWEEISSDEALKLRGGETGLILKDVFIKQITQLNPFITREMAEELITKIEKLPTGIEGNLQVWEYLKGIKTVYVPKEKQERNVQLINKDIRKNVFQVTKEFSYTNGQFTNRFDVVFLINGFPVFFVETKAAHKQGAMPEALDQVRRYHQETPEPLNLLQIYTLTHLSKFYYASTWGWSMKSLFDWKLESTAKDFEGLVKGFFSVFFCFYFSIY